MLEGAKEIISEGKNLEKATGEISGGMAEMASSADQISAAVSEVNSISGQNKEIIGNLVVAVSRFKADIYNLLLAEISVCKKNQGLRPIRNRNIYNS
jgi:methyl-accepting chemotaxis protein